MRLVYRPEAEADVERAYDWYERQRPGLGAEFLVALRTAERQILAFPFAARMVRRDSRRFLLARFPYQVLYRVVGDSIVIVACFHGRRSPRRWSARR